MPFRRDFPATTRILSFQAEHCTSLPTVVLLAWSLRSQIKDREEKRVDNVVKSVLDKIVKKLETAEEKEQRRTRANRLPQHTRICITLASWY